MKKQIILVMMIMVLLVGCASTAQNNKVEDVSQGEDIQGNDIIKLGNKVKVTTSTYPMYYIAKEIGRDNIDLNILIPIGVDPHEYDISLKEAKDLEVTELFIYNGSGLETWGEKVADNLKSKSKDVINASSLVELLNIEDHKSIDEHEDHNHGTKDPHIWLDPMNMDKIAQAVKEELKKLDPEYAEIYEKNYLELSEKLNSLDNKYNEALKNKKENTILVSHRAFEYLANRYGLNQIAITGISPHSEPSPKSLAELIKITREKNIKHIFFEVLSSPKSVEMIAEEANLETLTLHPIGGITLEQFDSGVDYIDLMEDNLDNLKKALVE